MRKSLLLATALCLASVTANAATLTVSALADADVVPPVCKRPLRAIYATTQAHNPVGLGYNNFNSTGNNDSFNLSRPDLPEPSATAMTPLLHPTPVPSW